MNEYIDRFAALSILCKVCGNKDCQKDVRQRCGRFKEMNDLPAADVKPVVRGEWLIEYEPDGKPYCLHCSVCDDDFSIIGITTASNFCPNCGADMRGKKHEDN